MNQRTSETKTEWPTWKTIQLGTHRSNKKLRQALVDRGFKIGKWGDNIFRQITAFAKQTEVELVIVAVSELGFPYGATRKKIYQKALSLGLKLCKAEVGPQLRLQYLDQPLGGSLLIAMEPIKGSGGYLSVFKVAHIHDLLWLDGFTGYLDDYWSGDICLVFCRK